MVRLSKTKLSSLLAILLGVSLPAQAQVFNLQKGAQEPVCEHVYEIAKKDTRPRFWPTTHELFRHLRWRKGGFMYNRYNDFPVSRPVVYADFDINNDGVNELISKRTIYVRGIQGEFLYVFEPGEYNFGAKPFIAHQVVEAFQGILSTPPWPYADFDLRLIKLYPFQFQNENFVGIIGVRPTDPLLIVKYTEETIPIDNEKSTSKLDVICHMT